MFGHLNSVSHCKFSPDDKYVASCSADGTLKVCFVNNQSVFYNGNLYFNTVLYSVISKPFTNVNELSLVFSLWGSLVAFLF